MLPQIFLIFLAVWTTTTGAYRVGVGRADCTGPPVEITFMGYAKAHQVGCGLHLRQFSRAFIVDDGQRRAAFVTVDAFAISEAVKGKVLDKLDKIYPNVYTFNNVIISGTHTHSTPGGFLKYVLYDFSVSGFVQETLDSLVDGITKSVTEAHKSMVEGKIYQSSGELLGANINRSPAAYLLNPAEERAEYSHDVDTEMVQLLFVRAGDDEPLGLINWFAVHANSMNNTNCLLSSDNLGYASILLESYFNNGSLPGHGPFVAAFASSNEGDVSPNTRGPICTDTGEECHPIHSTCDGVVATCVASGPGRDMFESTAAIARKLFEKSKELYHGSDKTEVTGRVNYIHQLVNMAKEKVTVKLQNGSETLVRGCLPAMGYSFGAGTVDGAGEFNIRQGSTRGGLFWNLIALIAFPLYAGDKACQYPKPILFNTGRENIPYYPWQPETVPLQIATIGQIALIAVPAEFTTMSGRRLRKAVRETIIANGGANDTKAIIAGLSNSYSSYVTTFEEYQLQRYEGASTIYGPGTLSLYIHRYTELAKALILDEEVEHETRSPTFPPNLVTLVAPPRVDCSWTGRFGDCLSRPPGIVTVGDVVTVEFAAANPRHNLQHGDTYLTVERLATGGNWTVVATDANWETRFYWKRLNWLSCESVATIQWTVLPTVEGGTYRISHKGHRRNIFGLVLPYNGTSQNFTVVAGGGGGNTSAPEMLQRRGGGVKIQDGGSVYIISVFWLVITLINLI